MGKTTLYHPLPLSVIRGAAEFCGWKFGRILQKRLDNDKQTALYTAEITLWSHHCTFMPVAEVTKHLQKCFMDDVQVKFLRPSRSGLWLVDLWVKYPALDEGRNE